MFLEKHFDVFCETCTCFSKEMRSLCRTARTVSPERLLYYRLTLPKRAIPAGLFRPVRLFRFCQLNKD